MPAVYQQRRKEIHPGEQAWVLREKSLKKKVKVTVTNTRRIWEIRRWDIQRNKRTSNEAEKERENTSSQAGHLIRLLYAS